MLNPIKKSYQNLDVLADTSLIVPSVSIGNVPQLASDLLLHNYKFSRIAHLNDTYLHPFSSAIDHLQDKPAEAGLSTALEVYYSKTYNLTLIQQRSPIIASFAETFVKEVILPFITQHNFKQVIILDSGDSGFKEHSLPGTIETYTNEDILSKLIESLQLSTSVKSLTDESFEHSKYAKLLALEVSDKITVNALVIYVYEGANFHDASVLAKAVATKLDLEYPEDPVNPISWAGVYGDKLVPNALEDGIYG